MGWERWVFTKPEFMMLGERTIVVTRQASFVDLSPTIPEQSRAGVPASSTTPTPNATLIPEVALLHNYPSVLLGPLWSLSCAARVAS